MEIEIFKARDDWSQQKSMAEVKKFVKNSHFSDRY
jgi:hypothetical protein